MDNNQEKLNRLATDVINLSKNILLVHLHFMDMALIMLPLYPFYSSKIE